MAKRGGLGISVKMILTTTLLIVVTVAGAGVLNVLNLRRTIDKATEDQVKQYARARRALGDVNTPLLARILEPLLAQRDDQNILAVVKSAVADDDKDDPSGKKDYGLRLAYVLDQRGALIAYCHEAAKLDCRAGLDHHDPIGAAYPLTTETWDAAKDLWKTTNEPLAKFDLPGDGASYAVWAYPVFFGAPATAAGALAAEAPDARLGYVVLGYDLSPVGWFAATAAEQKQAGSQKAALYTGAVGALFALIGVLLAIFQGLAISKPIKQLAWRADQIARGDLDARVEVQSGDEIGLLGENFNFMADQISILLQQTAEKARIEQELEVAKAIQETLVPRGEPVVRANLTFAGFYQPAAQTGGDWWTWADLANGKILVVIGDVTGHGVPSAMITAAAKAACDVARHVHDSDVAPTQLLEIMNHAIFSSAQRRFVMTCFASVIDTRARTITYANAGHNFPYLFRSGEGRGEFGSLMIRGNRLGDDPGSTYEAKTTELVAGDVVVWYTDGIVECENMDGEEYGEKRFRASVRKAAALDAVEMRDAIIADASAYFGDAARKDDITMVVGRIH